VGNEDNCFVGAVLEVGIADRDVSRRSRACSICSAASLVKVGASAAKRSGQFASPSPRPA
jgi:hypothetical protein